MASAIEFDRPTATIRSGDRVVAMQAKYPCGDQGCFTYWARNIELGGSLSVAVSQAIMTSPADISGEDLAKKIAGQLN